MALGNVKDAWGAVRKVAGLTSLRRLDLRRDLASVSSTCADSLPIIGALLGHTEAKTTQRYAHLAYDPLRQAADTVAATIAASMQSKPKEKTGP